MNDIYSGEQICIIVPTKDRPNYVEKLLDSFIDQVEHVRRIIIVASGKNIESTIDKFSSTLPLDYYYTPHTGQIRQRNIGISKLDDRTPLVGCIDDDIVLDPLAIKEMVKFWNNAPKNTGGVGFNNMSGHGSSTSIFQQFLFLGRLKPGRVLRSGATTSISHLKENIRSQWLTGGMSIWKKDILINYKHKEINTKWAIAEDLIFSYPLGKIFSLYVCSDAKVNHNHYPYDTKDEKWHFTYGRAQTIWIYYFVDNNNDLSKILFLITLFIRIISKYTYGLIARRRDLVNFAKGAISAIIKIVKFSFGLLTINDIRED